MASMASLAWWPRFGQKIDGLQGDELELEQAETSLDSENSDALALATSGIIIPETQGGTTAMPRSSGGRTGKYDI